MVNEKIIEVQTVSNFIFGVQVKKVSKNYKITTNTPPT